MSVFSGSSTYFPFEMFSLSHIGMIILTVAGVVLIGFFRHLLQKQNEGRLKTGEWIAAFTLIFFEVGYYLWLFANGMWAVSHGLPLELSSISVMMIIVLLFKRNRHFVEIMFLVGIGGAIQAIVTPVLQFDFPHFRYIHFFVTHIAVIWVVFYFIWVRGYQITVHSIWKAMLFLNVLLPFIFFINVLVDGNYWFIMKKPSGGSLLDLLGPHPWYILGMEAAALIFFTLLWLAFGRKDFLKR